MRDGRDESLEGNNLLEYSQRRTPSVPARLYKALLLLPLNSPHSQLGTPTQETSPFSLSVCCFAFHIPIACTARTVPARAEPPEPRPAAEILLGIGGR